MKYFTHSKRRRSKLMTAMPVYPVKFLFWQMKISLKIFPEHQNTKPNTLRERSHIMSAAHGGSGKSDMVLFRL